jgi:DNA-binding HxlR family transcriptional regulator
VTIDEQGGPCCPQYHLAVELIGRRWTGAIVAVLLADSPQRFSELRASVPGLSDRVLSQRMRELESEELVERTVHPGPPLRVEYSLTPKGIDLEPVVRALESWGQRWMDCAKATREPVAAAASRAEDPTLG